MSFLKPLSVFKPSSLLERSFVLRSPFSCTLGLVGLLTVGLIPAADAATTGEPTYTAQRKPRVTVMEFEDTNAVADSERFGPSVSAMLVTYLKRESQLVVVERQELKQILDEWERDQKGLTKLNLSTAETQLLESIDIILQGHVTVLNGEGGRRIEIDAKLLSRSDGRIITAAQRSGPESCLRPVVNRLGVALEQDYLRPYYGKLRVTFNDPENTHFHLTPVLRSDALDEEKPPVELGSTVFPGEDHDRRQPWVTNPTSHTIESILSGWYVLRLERPGYRGAAVDDSRFVVMRVRGETRVCYRRDDGRWIHVDSPQMNPEIRKFLVRVEPLTASEIDATALGFRLPKEQGSLMLAVLDGSSRPLREGRVLLRSIDLKINPGRPDRPMFPPSEAEEKGEKTHKDEPRPPAQALGMSQEEIEGLLAAVETLTELGGNKEEASRKNGGDAEQRRSPQSWGPTIAPKRCELLIEDPPDYRNHGNRIQRVGNPFHLDSFEGGALAFEDYRGEPVPAGTYEVVVWSPNYKPLQTLVNVADGDGGGEPRFLRLERKSRTVTLVGKSDSRVHFAGSNTGHEIGVRLDSGDGFQELNLPVDHYRVNAELTGFPNWHEELDLLPAQELPPSLEEFLHSPPGDISWLQEEAVAEELPIKSRVWVGGRVGHFLQVPQVFYDQRISEILDRILKVSSARRQLTHLRGGENDLEELERRLRDIDLLILDENDLSRLRVLPDAAAVVGRYVESGHALLAFITEPGDYQDILGVPLEIPRRARRSRKVAIRPGQVSGFALDQTIELGASRVVPKVKEHKHLGSRWRVLGYAKKGKKPCLLEWASPERGGYVMAWLDSVATHAELTLEEGTGSGWGRWLDTALAAADLVGVSVPKEVEYLERFRNVNSLQDLEIGHLGILQDLGVVESTESLEKLGWLEDLQELRELREQEQRRELPKKRRKALERAEQRKEEADDRLLLLKAQVKNHALDWAEYLMYRRLDGDASVLEEARARIMGPGHRVLSK